MNNNLLIINHDESEIRFIKEAVRANFDNIYFSVVTYIEDIFNEIEKHTPDFILFNIDFPKYEFNDSLQVIFKIVGYKRIPIIAISVNKKYKEIYEAGAISFIHKPFTDITLGSTISTAMKLIKNYKEIELQENEIKRKNRRIQYQFEQDLKQREIIIHKNNEMMADIRYASRIQQAILPDLDLISNFIEEYFILHQPKSHVSGDFYWVSGNEDQRIIAVGDCTGHGLSGGLMHMLGAVYLNQIVSRNNFKSSNDILEQLRYLIMKSLNQTGEIGEAHDGLDIALCVIDCKKYKLQFSGANNSLYIVRDGEIIEIKGDRMPVGIHVNFDKPFTNNEINLKANDQLYMFSDGYADQFGGPKGKKFRYKQFKELILKICHEPMNIQKEIMNNVYDNWRGSLDQIDDILVFGLKIK